MAKTAARSTVKVSSGNGSRGKAKGLSLHIGLNGVSGAAYGGWDGPLAACEFDANDMAAIAKQKGLKSMTMKGVIPLQVVPACLLREA